MMPLLASLMDKSKDETRCVITFTSFITMKQNELFNNNNNNNIIIIIIIIILIIIIIIISNNYNIILEMSLFY